MGDANASSKLAAAGGSVMLAVGGVKAAGRRLFAGFVKDVSARRQSEQRLQELQAELTHVARLTAMGSVLA